MNLLYLNQAEKNLLAVVRLIVKFNEGLWPLHAIIVYYIQCKSEGDFIEHLVFVSRP